MELLGNLIADFNFVSSIPLPSSAINRRKGLLSVLNKISILLAFAEIELSMRSAIDVSKLYPCSDIDLIKSTALGVVTSSVA